MLQEPVVTVGQVGDVPFEGQQVTFVLWREGLEVLAPGPATGQRVDRLGAAPGVGVVSVDDPPGADAYAPRAALNVIDGPNSSARSVRRFTTVDRPPGPRQSAAEPAPRRVPAPG
ncbi:hypothetical protein GCM10022214_02760 [Actinomadura miaoliensis]|uniref:Uncharacterized protein n=1 Tax=Actinomadura miaoliensis TaxID=430685 RepID=A0ABP7UY31_9ACTN